MCGTSGNLFIGGMEIDLELETAGSPCMPPLTPIAPVANGLSQPPHSSFILSVVSKSSMYYFRKTCTLDCC